MKLAIIVGTRPEIIKMSPIIRECQKRKQDSNKHDFFILHTGQHYSYHMDKVFFEQLQIPKASYNLDVGSGSHGLQTAKILAGVEDILVKEQPDIVLVQGDTNTVLAGALAASKLHIKVGHVEAGLRSYDRTMPEEINRIVADHIADFCFTPTHNASQILIKEGIPKEKIFVTGNTIVDAVKKHAQIAKERSTILSNLGLQTDEFFLVTSHRQENVDDKIRFTDILTSLAHLTDIYDIPVVYPIHPRARKMMKQFGLSTDKLRLIDPVDFFDFLQLQTHARLVLTDSGGVQEETCILGRPCVTLRDTTERPETVEVGGNILAGTDTEKIEESVSIMLQNKRSWKNPFGDGTSGKQILDIITHHIR
jgi:UDP-N-acetylglucosamine 2-epimerase (non-hydrolysing)